MNVTVEIENTIISMADSGGEFERSMERGVEGRGGEVVTWSI
mgnify:CR=1 FL=1